MTYLIDESLENFFSKRITTSLEVQEVDLSPVAEIYIVDVVSDLSSAAHELAPKSLYIKDMLRRGLSSDGFVRTEYLRITGDLALFVSGIFPDSLEKRKNCFTLGDFINIGREAYGSINTEVFNELALKFPELVDVLNNVSTDINLISKDIRKYTNRRRTIDALVTRR